MSQTKASIIETVAVKTKLPVGRAEAVVNHVFDALADALLRGEGVEVRGFGTFTVRSYRAYEGRNPRTGAEVHVSAKRIPFFKVGLKLRERVNDGRGSTAAVDVSRARVR
jgi:integration host factor subunit beta